MRKNRFEIPPDFFQVGRQTYKLYKRYHQIWEHPEPQIVPLTVASCLADKEIRLCRLMEKTREKEAKAGNKYLPHLCLEGLVTGWVLV